MSDFIKILLFVAVVVLVFSCSTANKSLSVKQSADQFFENNDFENALSGYEQIIADYMREMNTEECPVYGRAGISSLRTGNLAKAIDYLKMDTYTPFASEETYFGLAGCFRKKDNLSKEIISLQDYMQLYPEGKHIQEVKTRLFETYVESENWEAAQKMWPPFADADIHEDFLSQWFRVNLALKNDDECNIISQQLIKMNPGNIPALEWQAKEAFLKAENHYQTEMDAYEKNKTNKQYKRLLDELKIVSAQFQTAKTQYEKLYSLDSKAIYAQYLSNIYVRLNDQEKADYYRKKASQ
ncbi:MAG: hypothetical protein K9H16_14715 [Bacteroidales bacterium]|nr:hypothetical protein [Bacteroidales bacterium]